MQLFYVGFFIITFKFRVRAKVESASDLNQTSLLKIKLKLNYIFAR